MDTAPFKVPCKYACNHSAAHNDSKNDILESFWEKNDMSKLLRMNRLSGSGPLTIKLQRERNFESESSERQV